MLEIEKPKMDFDLSSIKIIEIADLPKRDFLIRRLRFERGCLINICGTGASGKTMFAQYMALCISEQRPLFDKFQIEPSEKQYSVLHIDQEQSEKLTQRRYSRLAKQLGIKEVAITRTRLPIKLDDPTIPSDEIQETLVKICSNYDVIILDSLRQAVLCDENNSQIATVVSMLKRVAELSNVVFIFIHHMGKSTGGKQTGRGSSAIFDNEDIQLDLTAEPSNGIVKISCAKNRDGVYFKGFEYELTDVGKYCTDQDCTEGLELRLILDELNSDNYDTYKRILQVIMNEKKVNNGDLFNVVRGSRKNFNKIIEEMVQQNLITETRGLKNAKFFEIGDNGESYMSYK